MASTLKRFLIGRPLATEEADHQRIPKTIGLAVFSSDAISSTAYATQEILLVLVPIQLKQRQMLRRTTQITAEYLQLSRTWYIAGGLATVLPLPILYLMVNKVA